MLEGGGGTRVWGVDLEVDVGSVTPWVTGWINHLLRRWQ